MAKPLVLQFRGATITFRMRKIDRNVLYGSREIEVLDEEDGRCELATLADDGRTIVGRGGTAFAYLAADGSWCEKSALKACDLDGRKIVPVGSSFSGAVVVSETASIDEYLTHNIKSVYLLDAENDASVLTESLQTGLLFKFPYSYRGGLEADVGFLLAGADGKTFLAVGVPTRIEYVGLAQPPTVAEEQEEEEEDAELLDFNMI